MSTPPALSPTLQYRVRPLLIPAALLSAVLSPLTLTWLMPVLWGPYAQVLADAGPLALSRGGMFLSLAFLPACALIYPALFSRGLLGWALKQTGALAIVGAAILGYGYYLHTVVNNQGLEASTESLAAEVGFRGAAGVPAHIKQALTVSNRLAAQGHAPWQPGAWRQVTWPAIPHQPK